MHCSQLALTLIYIQECGIHIRVYIDAFFMTLYFCCYLIVTGTPIFGYIKWTPDVALTGSFLGIVFCRYGRREIGENNATQKSE